MLVWRERLAGPRVVFAVTGRHGGASVAPYGSLNLADHVGDDPVAVAANRAGVAAAVGVDPAYLLVARQVHGRAVAVVDRPWEADPPEADGLVTSTPGVALAVLVADCTPVLLAGQDRRVVGVAHAGRAGLAARVVPAVVAAMRALGAGDLVARVGPSICARHYEVPAALREEVAAAAHGCAAVSRHGTPALDIAGGVLAQLADEGVAVDTVDGCSYERADLYSYRRDGVTGRYAGLAWLEP